jgi:hypothetical protein
VRPEDRHLAALEDVELALETTADSLGRRWQDFTEAEMIEFIADYASYETKALSRVLVRLLEQHFGCPSIAITNSEKEAWARGLATTDLVVNGEDFDAVFEAIA